MSSCWYTCSATNAARRVDLPPTPPPPRPVDYSLRNTAHRDQARGKARVGGLAETPMISFETARQVSSEGADLIVLPHPSVPTFCSRAPCHVLATSFDEVRPRLATTLVPPAPARPLVRGAARRVAANASAADGQRPVGTKRWQAPPFVRLHPHFGTNVSTKYSARGALPLPTRRDRTSASPPQPSPSVIFFVYFNLEGHQQPPAAAFSSRIDLRRATYPRARVTRSRYHLSRSAVSAESAPSFQLAARTAESFRCRLLWRT